MVCLGNICRSPLAHGILEARAKELGLPWLVDSCGTSNWHEGEGPDKRSVAVAAENGIDISMQRSRSFKIGDFDEYDHIIAMDSSNYSNLKALARGANDIAKMSSIQVDFSMCMT